MEVYQDKGRVYAEPRNHPWTVGEENSSFRYVDFKIQPELIPKVLEDFRPHASNQAVLTLYEFLRWVNGSDSHLETNDCGFRPPAPHRDQNSDKKLSCHGRLFIFYRNLRYNLKTDACLWLNGAYEHTFYQIDTNFRAKEGVIGLSDQKSYYTNLPYKNPNDILGGQLMISFWAYGNTEQETFGNLDRLFRNLWEVSKSISDHIRDKFNHEALKDS